MPPGGKCGSRQREEPVARAFAWFGLLACKTLASKRARVHESSAASPAAVASSRVPSWAGQTSSETPGHLGRPYANVRPSQPPPVLRSITAAASTPQHPHRPGTRSDSARIGRRGHRKPTPGRIPLSARRDATAQRVTMAHRAHLRRAAANAGPNSSCVRRPSSRAQSTRHHRAMPSTRRHRRDATDAPPRAGSTAPHHHRRGRRRSPTTPPSSRRCRGPEKEARPRPSPTSSS